MQLGYHRDAGNFNYLPGMIPLTPNLDREDCRQLLKSFLRYGIQFEWFDTGPDIWMNLQKTTNCDWRRKR